MNDEMLENRLRRLAERQGVALRKSPQSDPGADDYGKFQIVNPGNDAVIAGDEPYEYSLTVDDVERWLTNDEATPQAPVEEEPHKARRASKESDPGKSG